jgi:hypothetical protein
VSTKHQARLRSASRCTEKASSTVKEHPILFSAPMVQAIRGGRKRMTRRLCPAKWLRCIDPDDPDDNATALARCPYGVTGDRLWVRETWADADCMYQTHQNDVPGVIAYRADHSAINFLARNPKEVSKNDLYSWNFDRLKWKPSIHMPRWASRITLEITRVRLERIMCISSADILAEGAVARPHYDQNLGKCPVSAFDGKCYVDLLSLWAAGWDLINGKRAPWKANPWVWVVEFNTTSERCAL